MASGTGAQDMDDFVNVWFNGESSDGTSKPSDGHEHHGASGTFYEEWMHKAVGKHNSPELVGAHALRKLYPNHSLVMCKDFLLNPLSFPGAISVPLESSPLITNLVYVAMSSTLGTLAERIELGGFKVAWDKYDFVLYIVSWPSGSQRYILHEGSEAPSRAFLLAIGKYANQLHSEIWVFNQGYWQKDSALWIELQKSDWKDVILKDEKKEALKKDIYGFFKSEKIYKDLAIPWKRGLIMYGPPGNGKTISIKTIMKTCDAQGYTPLYVKSFKSYAGEEYSMAQVFNKARQHAPCVLVLEDLDSLINDQNRSFFLNQLDGLEGNDGLLVIGSTNHFERLDPGLSTRPSRFDRKFNFEDPDYDERVLYAKYWQSKLKNNDEISFPDALVEEIANSTDQFSFAYLKEAFVSSLVTLAGIEGKDKPLFAAVLKDQIKILRKQLDKSTLRAVPASNINSALNPRLEPALYQSVLPRDIYDKPNLRTSRAWSSSFDAEDCRRQIRVLLDRLASTGSSSSRDLYRRVYDRIAEQGNSTFNQPANWAGHSNPRSDENTDGSSSGAHLA